MVRRCLTSFLAAILVMLSLPGVPASHAGSGNIFPALSVTPGLSGAAAVSALGGKLPEVAGYYGLTAEQLRQRLLRDEGLRLARTGHLLRLSAGPGASATTPFAAPAFTLSPAAARAIPLDETFRLHSKPDAPKTIYLNFEGAMLYAEEHLLVALLDPMATELVVPPFSIDGDATFSDAERRMVQEVWQRVAEDFSPFDVDVTTEPPAPDRISRANDGDQVFGLDVIVAPDSIPPGVQENAGLSAPGSFFAAGPDGDMQKPALVFYDVAAVDVRLLADAASREIGTTLGLSADTQGCNFDPHPGQGTSPVNGWAPIMGALSAQPLRQFDKGEYANPGSACGEAGTPPQDDFRVITSSGLSLRADEAGNTRATASWLPVTSSGGRSAASHDGVITPAPFSASASLAPDVDVFHFEAGAGPLNMRVDPASYGPNADLVLTLLDSAGNVLRTDNPIGQLDAAISYDLPTPGTYYLDVRGTGEGSPLLTGYSSYGSVGAYRISGGFPAPPSTMPSASFTYAVATGSAPHTVMLDPSASAVASGTIMHYRWDFGDGTSLEAATAAPLQKTFASPGTYVVTLTVTSDSGLTGSTSRSIFINAPPSASFALSMVSDTDLTVSLDASPSRDDVAITSYRWDFGDGTSQEGASPGPVLKTYDAAGSYTVTLVVTDGAGLTDSTTRSVDLTGPPPPPPPPPPPAAPTASFSATSGPATLQVTFDASESNDSDGTITSYIWDFGDGSTEEASSPAPLQKTYAAPGRYEVTLRVTDNDGLVAETSRTVTVTPAPVANEPRIDIVSVSFAPSGRTRLRGRALVTVLDAAGLPANRATVIARWSGTASAVSSARTGRFGQAGLSSPATAGAGCLRVTVVGVRIGRANFIPPVPASAEVCR